MEAIYRAAFAMARALLPYKPFLAHEAADLALGPEQQESLLLPWDLRLSTPPEWKETLLHHERRSLQNLTPRQRKAYWAYRLEESVKKAARRARMTERDLRVAKKEIARKFKKSSHTTWTWVADN